MWKVICQLIKTVALTLTFPPTLTGLVKTVVLLDILEHEQKNFGILKMPSARYVAKKVD